MEEVKKTKKIAKSKHKFRKTEAIQQNKIDQSNIDDRKNILTW